MKKILILYTSVGLGHKTIAENIGAYLESRGFEVKLNDILQVQAGWLVSVSTALHQFINRYLPFVWKWLYFGTNSRISDWTLPLRIRIASRNCANTKHIIEEFGPDVVIATQTTASAVVAHLKKEKIFNGLFGIAFSDFHLHRFWLYPQADFYLANIPEQKRDMEILGFGGKKIFLCGMATKPKPEVDVGMVRAKFRLKEGERVVLVGVGSLGIGLHESMIPQLVTLPDTRVLVVCGKSLQLKDSLNKKFAGKNAVILGFYTPMAELYAIADVFITKPGGLSITESLQWRLPAFVTHMLPGQEELNIEYLVRNRLIVFEPFSLMNVKKELDSRALRTQLELNSNVTKVLEAPGLREAADWLVAQ